MIKLFSLKQQAKAGTNPQSTKKTSAAYLRVQKGNVQSKSYVDAASFDVGIRNYDVYLYMCRYCRAQSAQNLSVGVCRS